MFDLVAPERYHAFTGSQGPADIVFESAETRVRKVRTPRYPTQVPVLFFVPLLSLYFFFLFSFFLVSLFAPFFHVMHRDRFTSAVYQYPNEPVDSDGN